MKTMAVVAAIVIALAAGMAVVMLWPSKKSRSYRLWRRLYAVGRMTAPKAMRKNALPISNS
jgi:hypothetical protein